MKRLLLTFGCSWTYGVGANYQKGMDHNTYLKNYHDPELCRSLGWRGIVSEQYQFDNINFSLPGSSNNCQFRLAKEFFPSDQFKKLQKSYDQILVLWGITSTARSEMFCSKTREPKNFFYTANDELSKSFLKYSYNHDYEVQQLATEMRFWNLFFTNLGITNFWFDTFNHHHYENLCADIELKYKTLYDQVKGQDWPTWQDFRSNNIDVEDAIYQEIMNRDRWPFAGFCQNTVQNLMLAEQTPRDLLSLLAIKNGCQNVDSQYHMSNWSNDSNRVDYLVGCEILNPFTYHPTQQGHKQIAQIICQQLDGQL